MKIEQASDQAAPSSIRDKRPVAIRLLAPLTAGIIFLAVGFGSVVWWLQELRLEDSFNRNIETVLLRFQTAVTREAAGMQSTLAALALNKDLAGALRQRDSDRLLSISNPLFKLLQTKHAITHFYFMDANRICLLRVHMPNKKGDLIDRFSARESERTRNAAGDIELGPLGALTLRAVLPIFEEDTLLGYIELGKEFENVLKDLHRDVELELAVTIRKDALDRAQWENGMAVLGREADWDRFEDLVLIYHSIESLPSGFDQVVVNHSHEFEKAKVEIENNNEVFCLAVKRLSDASGRELGGLIIIQNISALKASFNRMIAIGATALAGVTALLVWYFFFELKQTDTFIQRREAELLQSRENYRQLFVGMNSGFALYEIICDDQSKPCNYRFLNVNPSFEKLTGLNAQQVVGKQLSEVFPTVGTSLIQRYNQVVATGNPVEFEEYISDLDKSFEIRAFRPSPGGFAVTFLDISERKRAERKIQLNNARLRSLAHILKQSADSTQDFLDFALNEAVKLTASRIGYIYHYDEKLRQFKLNTWSKEVMNECTVIKPQTCYDLDMTGVCGEAVRQRKMIILNDYQADHPLKRGYPEGHVALHKFMTVPVYKGDCIIAVVGVANKKSDYDETDILQLTLLMDSVFKVVELKQAEDALRESEARYRMLYEQAPIPYQSLDGNGNFLEVNSAFLNALGYTREEVIGRSFGDFLAPDWSDHYNHHFQRFKAVGEILGVEFEMLKKDGSMILVSFDGRIGRDHSGQFKQTHCVFTDITERHKVETALRQSEEKLSEAQKLARIGQWEFNLKTNQLKWSDSVFELFEIDPPEFEATYDAFLAAVHPEDRQRVDRAHADSVKNRTPYEISHRLLMKDGRIKWVNEIARTDYDEEGRPLLSIGTVQDITLIKDAEEQIRDSEERNRRLVEASLDAILVRSEGVITFANPAALKLFHANDQSDLIGKRYLDLVHPEDRAESAERVRKNLNENWIATPREHRIITLDELVVDVESTGVPVQFEGRTQIFGVFRDITERKQAEKEKNKLEGQLRQVQKLEAIGTLAGGIAHDFNNILGVIIGNSEMLTIADDVSAEVKEGINQILTASQRARKLVSQILTFSRQGEQQKMLINLKPIIKETLGFLCSSLSAKIELRYCIKPDVGNILGDPTQIQQVLMNLCTNAWHAMEGREGVLRIELENVVIAGADGQLNPKLEEQDYVRLTVSDNGHGMEPSIRERIFDPYFTTKGPGKGTGLGLAVVHGIVQSHGGIIKVYSEIGRGTTFEVYLPRADGSEESALESCRVLPKGNEKILYVDDEVELASLGKKMLERLGYQIQIRTSSIEALELFRSNPDRFDAIITDMTMPQMNGLALAREILAIRPNIPIILCTGFSDEANETRARSVGIRAFLFKPIILFDIASKIREVIDQYKSSKSI